MNGIDETDIEILQLLTKDARRSYSEIAEQLGVSQPTISNRVERLREMGVIHRFTLDLDRSVLQDGVSLLIDIEAFAETVDDVSHAFRQDDAVHTVYTTADSHVIVITVYRPDQIHELVARTVSQSEYADYEIKILINTSSNPSIGETEFSVDCDNCGNRVVSGNGTSTRLDGTLYHFCCELCEGQFTDKYESLKQNA